MDSRCQVVFAAKSNPTRRRSGRFSATGARKELAMETATTNATTTSDNAKSNRGFASMSTDRQREIARKGGRAAHAKGTAHEFTTDEARAAGQKGGQRVSTNREHMSRIGRIGGKRSAGRR